MARPTKSRGKGYWFEGSLIEELKPEDQAYKYVVSKMAKNSQGIRFNFHKISTIKNAETWKNYKAARSRICEELGGEFVTEKRLFHGSSAAPTISQLGFLTSKSVSGGGTFFSDLSGVSDGYAKKNGGTTYTMLICRVAMGKMLEGSRGPLAGYHSFHNGSEFVIYDEKQAYPSFIVEYS